MKKIAKAILFFYHKNPLLVRLSTCCPKSSPRNIRAVFPNRELILIIISNNI